MKKVNSKKKGIILLIAVMLLVGGSIGSYAWFTRNVEINPNLVIKVGTFELEDVTPKDPKWEFISEGNETRQVEEGVDFVNVKPGDYFTKTFSIKNTGSLNQKLLIKSISDTVFKEKLNAYGIQKGIEDLGTMVVLTPISGINAESLEAGATLEFTITITINGMSTNDGLQGASINILEALDTIKFIEIEASQTNVK